MTVVREKRFGKTARKTCSGKNVVGCGALPGKTRSAMKIKLSTVLVDDQEKALDFYTRVLGFVKIKDIPAGDFRWLTVAAPDSLDVELLLEPMSLPIAREYQKALYDAAIPITAFAVDDIYIEHKRLLEMGVNFELPPTATGPVTVAVLDDTCGNYIQLYQE